MNEMVERVARALENESRRQMHRTQVGFGRRQIDIDRDRHDVARAAIEAMREPTDAMVSAGSVEGGYDGYRDEENTLAIWSAMIDAAIGAGLKE